MFRRILALIISLSMLLQQAGFAQIGMQPVVSTYMQSLLPVDAFRPVQMRSLSFDALSGAATLLVDKGSIDEATGEQLEQSVSRLMDFFYIGLALPNSSFWVNLRPDAQDQIIDPLLEKTDLGKILLEADLQLKKDLAALTSPKTPQGKAYWDKLYARAESLFGQENAEIPTHTRPWIVPGEIIIKETPTGAYVYKAGLKVMLEEDYAKSVTSVQYQLAQGVTPTSTDPRLQQLNDYSPQLIRSTILPMLTRQVNASKKYAQLRQAYYCLVLAQWFKSKRVGSQSLLKRIDSKDLSGLTSQNAWTKQTYFNDYKKSFENGEYAMEDTVQTPGGLTVRKYFSGGLNFQAPVAAYSFKGNDGGVDRSLVQVKLPASNNDGGAFIYSKDQLRDPANAAIIAEQAYAASRSAEKINVIVTDEQGSERKIVLLDFAPRKGFEQIVREWSSLTFYPRDIGGVQYTNVYWGSEAAHAQAEFRGAGLKITALRFESADTSKDIKELGKEWQRNGWRIYGPFDANTDRDSLSPQDRRDYDMLLDRDGGVDRSPVQVMLSGPNNDGGVTYEAKELFAPENAEKIAIGLYLASRDSNKEKFALLENGRKIKIYWPGGLKAADVAQSLREDRVIIFEDYYGNKEYLHQGILPPLNQEKYKGGRWWRIVGISVEQKKKVIRLEPEPITEKSYERWLLDNDGGTSIGFKMAQGEARNAQRVALAQEIRRELQKPGSANLPNVAFISDYHGDAHRFAQLLSDAFNKIAGFKGALNPDDSIEGQLNKQGLSLKTLTNPVILGGDLFDRGTEGIQCFLMVKEMVSIAPESVFYISGNHDFWAFGNMLGLHLPWYEGFRFYDESTPQQFVSSLKSANELIGEKRISDPKLFESQEAFLWWTARLAEYNADQDEFQAAFLDGKAKDVRAEFVKFYADNSGKWNDQQIKSMEDFAGHFARIKVPDPYVGLNGVGKTSTVWWQDLHQRLLEAYTARKQAGADSDELNMWQRAVGIAQTAAEEVQARLAAAQSDNKWWYFIFEAINTQAYASVEWWCKDWSSHKGWGEAVLAEINELIEKGVLEGPKVDQSNYPLSPVLQAYAKFCRENFNLYLKDPYGNLYSHSWFPVQQDASISVDYKGKHYQGADIFSGLDAITADVADFSKTLSQLREGLKVVNTWYADETTIIKPENIKENREKIGVAAINKGIGVLNWVTGHNTLDKLDTQFLHQDGAYTHVEADNGMSPKFGGKGGYVLLGPQGIDMRGFESGDSDKVVTAPVSGANAHVGMPAKEYLSNVLTHLWIEGKDGGEAVEQLIELVTEHADRDIRIQAAIALGYAPVGNRKRAVDSLIKALLGAKPLARHDASWNNLLVAVITALGKIGDNRSADSLVEVLQASKDGDGAIRAAAAQAVGNTGRPLDSKAIAALIRVLEDPAAVGQAALALGKIGDQSAVEPLKTKLAEFSNRWTSDKARILFALERLYSRGFKDLEAERKQSDREYDLEKEWERQQEKAEKAAADAEHFRRMKTDLEYRLGNDHTRDGGASIDSQIKTLKNVLLPKAEREKAAVALVAEKRMAVEPLIDVLSAKDEFVVAQAAWALGEIGDEKAFEPLRSQSVQWASNTAAYSALIKALSQLRLAANKKASEKSAQEREKAKRERQKKAAAEKAGREKAREGNKREIVDNSWREQLEKDKKDRAWEDFLSRNPGLSFDDDSRDWGPWRDGGLVLDKPNSQVYIGKGNVVEIRSTSNYYDFKDTLVGTIPANGRVNALALDLTNSELYIGTDKGVEVRSVSAYYNQKGTLIATIPVEGRVRGLALDLPNHDLYVLTDRGREVWSVYNGYKLISRKDGGGVDQDGEDAALEGVYHELFRSLLMEKLSSAAPNEKLELTNIEKEALLMELTLPQEDSLAAIITILDRVEAGQIEQLKVMARTTAELQKRDVARQLEAVLQLRSILGSLNAAKDGGNKIDALANVLENKDLDQSERKIAGEALATKEAGGEPLLLGLLSNQDRFVREQAIVGLGKLKSWKAVKPLIAMLLEDLSGEDASTIAKALGLIGHRWAAASLTKALKESDNNRVRIEAARALRATAITEEKEALDALIAALDDGNSSVVIQAAISLGAIGDERAVEPLLKQTEKWQGSPTWVNPHCYESLERLVERGYAEEFRAAWGRVSYRALPKDGGQAIDTLVADLNNVLLPQDARLKAAEALAAKGSAAAESLMSVVGEIADPIIQSAAIAAIGETGDQKAYEFLSSWAARPGITTNVYAAIRRALESLEQRGFTASSRFDENSIEKAVISLKDLAAKPRTSPKDAADIRSAIAKLKEKSQKNKSRQDGGKAELSTARLVLAVDKFGGVDFRALPADPVNAAMGMPAVDIAALKALAAGSKMSDLNKEWQAIEKQLQAKSMPCEKVKEFVAVCCLRKNAGNNLARAQEVILDTIKMEEACAIETTAQERELLVLLESI